MALGRIAPASMATLKSMRQHLPHPSHLLLAKPPVRGLVLALQLLQAQSLLLLRQRL